jgi:deoxyribodipyrimidine photo-lyase
VVEPSPDEPDTPPTSPATDAVPATDSGAVVWHCRGLRTTDHPALAHAADRFDELLPVFVFDPRFYGEDGLACDARISCLHDCLTGLDRQHHSRGGCLALAHADPVEVLSRFREAGWAVVTTADPVGRYGLQRDDAVAEACDATFVVGDGLRHGDGPSREGWQEHVTEWFQSAPATWDADAVRLQTTQTPVTVADIERAYDVSPTKSQVPEGGRTAAVEALNAFTESIGSYPGSISAPQDAREGTSQLSPYLRFGCLSVREVYQHVTEHAPDCRGREMFISRLYWNRHYSQKLVDWPGWMDTAVNPVMEEFHADTHDPDLVAAWKRGETGYPMVDASMRCLRGTGWLNFRMRAMSASVFCDLLQQPWWVGADWFYYHLIDADPAINYTQWQSQAGLVGTPAQRIYNPRKQVRDQDPEGEWIRRWVPELDSLPVEHLDQPEKTPVHVQQECGVEIGEDYPYPVVEYERAREQIKAKFRSVQDRAKAALNDPEVARRASLSRRGRRSTDSPAEPGREPHETEQASLSSFRE